MEVVQRPLNVMWYRSPGFQDQKMKGMIASPADGGDDGGGWVSALENASNK